MALTYEYKGFTLIDPSFVPPEGTVPPWGTIEDTHHVGVIDWVGADCISTTLDVVYGHKHGRIWSGYGQKTFDSHAASSNITIGLCDDAIEGQNKNITTVIGDISSSYKIQDFSGIEFLNIDVSDEDDRSVTIHDGLNHGLSIDTYDKITTIGMLGGASDDYGNTAAVHIKGSHFASEAFSVSDFTTGEKSVSIDNGARKVLIGGTSFNVTLGGSGGGDVAIGWGVNTISGNLMRENGSAFNLNCGLGNIINIDTRSNEVYQKTQIGTEDTEYPITINKAGKVFTRDTFEVDHAIYGLESSPAKNSVKLTMIGGIGFLHIDLDGTKTSASDLYVMTPFKSGFSFSDGDCIAASKGIDQDVEKVVALSYDDTPGGGCLLRLVPIGGTWTTGHRCAVKITVPFLVSDPEFVNEMPT